MKGCGVVASLSPKGASVNSQGREPLEETNVPHDEQPRRGGSRRNSPYCQDLTAAPSGLREGPS